MSARSQEWYSVEANAEKRRARMRRYQAALTELGTRYVQQRQTAYQLARAAGFSFSGAQSTAYRIVRDLHRAEFDRIRAVQEDKAHD